MAQVIGGALVSISIQGKHTDVRRPLPTVTVRELPNIDLAAVRANKPTERARMQIEPSGSAPPCSGVGRLTAQNGVNAVFADGCIS
jgi:hypothetical protein